MATTATRKPRRTPEQIKHDHYLKLVVLRRQGRLHRVYMQAEHCTVWCNGEAIELYASKTYKGYAYVVRDSECGCDGFEHRHTCSHVQDASKRAVARYYAARQVAAEVLGDDLQDMSVHVEDDLATERRAEPEQVKTEIQTEAAINEAERIVAEAKEIKSIETPARELAPLSSNAGFSFLKPANTPRKSSKSTWATPLRRQEEW